PRAGPPTRPAGSALPLRLRAPAAAGQPAKLLRRESAATPWQPPCHLADTAAAAAPRFLEERPLANSFTCAPKVCSGADVVRDARRGCLIAPGAAAALGGAVLPADRAVRPVAAAPPGPQAPLPEPARPPAPTSGRSGSTGPASPPPPTTPSPPRTPPP